MRRRHIKTYSRQGNLRRKSLSSGQVAERQILRNRSSPIPCSRRIARCNSELMVQHHAREYTACMPNPSLADVSQHVRFLPSFF